MQIQNFNLNMPILETHIVPEGVENIRLSDYAPTVFKIINTKKGIKKAIKKELILVDNKVGATATWIKSGQKIELLAEDNQLTKIYRLPLPIVYEDEFIAVVNKPGGIPVHGRQFHTLENALPFNLKYSTQTDALQRLHPVHRLDAPTCGLIIIAKTRQAELHLREQFLNKTIKKNYQAIVIGKLDGDATIQQPIDNKEATTHFKTLQQVPSLKNEWLTLVELLPVTGRTHQLRIHLSGLGFPILGDKLYGKEGLILKNKGLFLCATTISFLHPIHQKIVSLSISPPNKFHLTLNREQRRYSKYFNV